MTEMELFRTTALFNIRRLIGSPIGGPLVRRKDLDKTFKVTKSKEVKNWYLSPGGRIVVTLRSPDGSLEANFINYMYERSVCVELNFLKHFFTVSGGNRKVGSLWDIFLDYRQGIHEFTEFELKSIPKLLEKEGFPVISEVKKEHIFNLSYYFKTYLSIPVDIHTVTRLYGHLMCDEGVSKELKMIGTSSIKDLAKTITKVRGKIDMIYLTDVLSDERSQKRLEKRNNLENSILEYHLFLETLRESLSEKYNIPKDMIDLRMFDIEKNKLKCFNCKMYKGIS